MAPGNLLENIHDHHRVCLVQVAGRLIRQNDGRVLDNGSCNGNALLLTAGKRIRRAIGKFLHADIGKRHAHPARNLLPVGHTAQNKRICHIFADGLADIEVVILKNIADVTVAQIVGVLPHILPVDQDTAAVQGVQSPDGIEQCGFAAAASAEHRHHAGFRQFQPDPVDDMNLIPFSAVVIFVRVTNTDLTHSPLAPPLRVFRTLSWNILRTYLRDRRAAIRINTTPMVRYAGACRKTNC